MLILTKYELYRIHSGTAKPGHTQLKPVLDLLHPPLSLGTPSWINERRDAVPLVPLMYYSFEYNAQKTKKRNRVAARLKYDMDFPLLSSRTYIPREKQQQQITLLYCLYINVDNTPEEINEYIIYLHDNEEK